jgi:hypothetical protein
MRLKIILLATIMCMMGDAMTQTKAFQFGFKLGPNIGWVKPDATDYNRTGVNLGFNWGFTGEFFLMENYSFNSGFNVIYLNGQYSYPDRWEGNSGNSSDGLNSRKIRTQYLQIPAILKMKTNEFNNMRAYGQVGFGLGFMLRAKADDVFSPIGGGSSIEDNKKDVRNELRRTRESFIIGAGVEFPLGGSTFLKTGLLFDNGFIDVLKDQNKVNPSVEHKGIMNLIELQISLLF